MECKIIDCIKIYYGMIKLNVLFTMSNKKTSYELLAMYVDQ